MKNNNDVMFKLAWRDYDNESSPTGDGTIPDFVLDDSGNLQQIGVKDVYAEIQTHTDECNIMSLIARAANGDTLALHQKEAQFMDIVDVPTTLTELIQKNTILDSFNKLPDDVKKLYKDIDDVQSALNDGSLTKALESYYKSEFEKSQQKNVVNEEKKEGVKFE